MYFAARSRPADGLSRPCSSAEARYSMCFIASRSGFSTGGGGGSSPETSSAHESSTPESSPARSSTFSVQAPSAGCTGRPESSKVPFKEEIAAGLRSQSTSDWPCGPSRVTRRSPGQVCSRSRESETCSVGTPPGEGDLGRDGREVLDPRRRGRLAVGLGTLGGLDRGRGEPPARGGDGERVVPRRLDRREHRVLIHGGGADRGLFGGGSRGVGAERARRGADAHG